MLRRLFSLLRAPAPTPLPQRLTGEQLVGHACREDDDAYWKLLPKQGSGSTGEARFACLECGKEMFRGGWGSELWLDPTHPMYHPPKPNRDS